MDVRHIEVEDLVQEGRIAKLLAIEMFDVGKGIQFRTYCNACAENSMLNWIRQENRKGPGHRGMRNANGKPARYLRLADNKADEQISNDAEINLAFERARLTDKQVRVMEARALGMNVSEIGRECGVSGNAAFQMEGRARERLRRFSEEQAAASEVA